MEGDVKMLKIKRFKSLLFVFKCCEKNQCDFSCFISFLFYLCC